MPTIKLTGDEICGVASMRSGFCGWHKQYNIHMVAGNVVAASVFSSVVAYGMCAIVYTFELPRSISNA